MVEYQPQRSQITQERFDRKGEQGSTAVFKLNLKLAARLTPKSIDDNTEETWA